VEVKYIFWRDENTLEVVVDPYRGERLDTIRVRLLEGVKVVTTVLGGTSKKDVMEAVPIEVRNECDGDGRGR
jgi:hypothetical protein